jgi:hypothetical protein
VFHPISVSPYLVPLPPGDDPIAVTVIIIIIIIITTTFKGPHILVSQKSEFLRKKIVRVLRRYDG